MGFKSFGAKLFTSAIWLTLLAIRKVGPNYIAFMTALFVPESMHISCDPKLH